MDIPDYLQPHIAADADNRALDLVTLMREHAAFPASESEVGLQLADTVAAAFTKAMNGKLPALVWRQLGPLMLQKPHQAPTARLIALGHGDDVPVGGYQSYVLTARRNRSKKMFLAA